VSADNHYADREVSNSIVK